MPATRNQKRSRLSSSDDQVLRDSKKIKVEKDNVAVLHKSVGIQTEGGGRYKQHRVETAAKVKQEPVAGKSADSDTEDEEAGDSHRKNRVTQKTSVSVTSVKLGSADLESDSDSEDTENGYSAYEQKRLQNIQDNARFFSKLGILEAKQNLQTVTSKNGVKPSQRGLKREKPIPLPRRAPSLRLRRMDPDGVSLPPEPPKDSLFEAEPEHQRKPEGPLQMAEYLWGDDVLADHQHLMKGCKSMFTCKITPVGNKSPELDSFLQKFSKISLTAERVAKMVPNRSFSLAVHPSERKVLLACGGKWGKVGLWDVMATDQESHGVVAYNPHSRPVNCLTFSDFYPEKLFSSSYDGTLRCLDFDKATIDQIYATPEDDEILVNNFDFLSPDTMLVSHGNGCVALVDTRTDGFNAEHQYQLHQKSVRTVSVHPVDKQQFITGSADGSICLWDLRRVKKTKNVSLDVVRHGKMVNSAYFSPLTGKYILSTSMDDRVNIYDSSKLSEQLNLLHSIRHCNQTGRWLTKFRAVWHPTREDLFVVGSMDRPRQIHLFSDKGQLVKDVRSEDYLASVCSLNVIHPTLNVLAGTNSSARVHVFM